MLASSTHDHDMFQSESDAGADLLRTANRQKFATILADPPWQFQNRTGKVAPEHKRLSRYGTMTIDEICDLPMVTAGDGPDVEQEGEEDGQEA